MVQTIINDDALTQAIFETFRKYGYEGTSIALLSAQTGLKKSSLYHRFPAGKEEMAKTAVRYMQTQIQQKVIVPLLSKNVLPETRFATLIENLQQYFADGAKNCLLGVLSIGEDKPEIQQQLNVIYDAFLYALEKLAQEVGMDSTEAKLWSERFLILLEGALVIQRLTKNKTMFIQQMQFEQQQFNQRLAAAASEKTR
jgi:TetR/AcrR family transcriptional regulator, lmrAB and yxaGH operons repressor